MKQMFALIIVLMLGGCSGTTRPEPPATGPVAPAESIAPAASAVQPPAAPEAVAPPPPSTPQLKSGGLTRDEMRDNLLTLLQEPGGDPLVRVKAYVESQIRYSRPGTVPYVEADLDGDGQTELVAALPVVGRINGSATGGGALFVVYRKDGQWAVDRSDPLDNFAEVQLMEANLFGVADLTGAGHPQIIWFRPTMIATGPMPFSVFVTAWQPGSFTLLPGAMAISFTKKGSDAPYLARDGKDLLLSGSNRGGWPALPDRTDRYRFIDGAFRLVDRHLLNNGVTGYNRLWDGLVAEEVVRTADAEQAYRDAADPQRPAHSGSYPIYGIAPQSKVLTDAEMGQFAAALRPFARFRLGELLLQAGHKAEAQEALKSDGGPYIGLTEAMRAATNREAGCKAATAWATADPSFLQALNLGGPPIWTPDVLCAHPSIEDSYMGHH